MTDFASFVSTIIGLINPLIGLLTAVALVYFLWGVTRYIMSSSDTGAKTEGRDVMIWGVIALFVLTSVWGIVNVVTNTFLSQPSYGAPAQINSKTQLNSPASGSLILQ